MMVQTSRPPSFVTRPRMRHMSLMLIMRVLHRGAEGLVALRRVFGEDAALPGGVARLAEQNWLQAELRPDDGANHEAAIGRSTVQDVPHVNDVIKRPASHGKRGFALWPVFFVKSPPCHLA